MMDATLGNTSGATDPGDGTTLATGTKREAIIQDITVLGIGPWDGSMPLRQSRSNA
jgi:hypothetical protein